MPVLNPTKPSAKAKKETPAPVERPIKYPEYFTEIFTKDNPLTVEKAKELLGWESESDYIAKMMAVDPNAKEEAFEFGSKFMLEDANSEKIRCHNNIRNRPFSRSTALKYANDILKRYWKLNGESIIIGASGIVLSGQHRLVGLVLAEQKRLKSSGGYDDQWGAGPCTMESVVFYGTDESPETTRTIDNVKARTLADILFADTTLFEKLTETERKHIVGLADWAVRTMWERTGAKSDPWTPYRSHSESLDFIERHPKLIECIQFIYDQDKDGNISKYIPPGHAAALMYLMGCSGTNDEAVAEYRMNYPHKEENVTWKNWKKATAFWVDLAREAPELKALRAALRPIYGDVITGDNKATFTGQIYNTAAEEGEGGGTLQEKIGAIVKAWQCYKEDENITVKRLELEYEFQPTDDGKSVAGLRLTEFPQIGGIDQGHNPKRAKEAEEETPNDPNEMTDEEFAAGGKGKGKKGKAAATPSKTPQDEFAELKAAHPGKVLVFKGVSGNYVIRGDDAVLVGGLTGNKAKPNQAAGGMMSLVISPAQWEEYVPKIQEAGHSLMLSELNGKEHKLTDVPLAAPTEKPTPVKGGKAGKK